MASRGPKKSVLFVCLGNICRSPMAEAIFLDLLEQRGIRNQWVVDSAGTGDWHVGSSPDKRTMEVLEKNGIITYQHKARVIDLDDYLNFDYIFGMDDENLGYIKMMEPPNCKAKFLLLGSFDPEGNRIIDDPYFTHNHNKNAFNEVYDQCLRCCTAFLDSVSKK